jgi:hypothetical protein
VGAQLARRSSSTDEEEEEEEEDLGCWKLSALGHIRFLFITECPGRCISAFSLMNNTNPIADWLNEQQDEQIILRVTLLE